MSSSAAIRCLVVGFGASELRVLRSLVGLFRSSLRADWVLVDEGQEHDAILCNLDAQGGLLAWDEALGQGLPCIGASSVAASDSEPWMLRRPIRGHGPHGLVEVLNAVAAGVGPSPLTSPRPAAAAAAAFAEARAPAASPPPSAAAAQEALPVRTVPEAVASAVPQPAAPPPPLAAPPPPPPPAAVAPPPRPSPAVPPALRGEAASPPVGRPAALTPHAARPSRAEREEGSVREVLQRMRFPSRGIPFEDTNLLAVLRWILGQEEPVVLTLGDLPSLCVVPEGRCYYSEIDLKDLAAAVAAKPAPVIRVAPFGRFEEAQEASGTTTAPPRSLDHRFWVACVHSPVEEVEHNARLMHRLRRWPDLGQLPHRPEHLRWSGVLVRMPMTLAGLAASTGSRRQDASAFLDACAELRLLETRPATAAELATASVPDESTQTKQVRKRVSILRTILSKLGVRAS